MRKIKPTIYMKLTELLCKAIGAIGAGTSIIMFLVYMNKTTYETWPSVSGRMEFDLIAIIISAISVILLIAASVLDYLNNK